VHVHAVSGCTVKDAPGLPALLALADLELRAPLAMWSLRRPLTVNWSPPGRQAARNPGGGGRASVP
jgi:hypothetical protein